MVSVVRKINGQWTLERIAGTMVDGKLTVVVPTGGATSEKEQRRAATQSTAPTPSTSSAPAAPTPAVSPGRELGYGQALIPISPGPAPVTPTSTALVPVGATAEPTPDGPRRGIFRAIADYGTGVYDAGKGAVVRFSSIIWPNTSNSKTTLYGDAGGRSSLPALPAPDTAVGPDAAQISRGDIKKITNTWDTDGATVTITALHDFAKNPVVASFLETAVKILNGRGTTSDQVYRFFMEYISTAEKNTLIEKLDRVQYKRTYPAGYSSTPFSIYTGINMNRVEFYLGWKYSSKHREIPLLAHGDFLWCVFICVYACYVSAQPELSAKLNDLSETLRTIMLELKRKGKDVYETIGEDIIHIETSGATNSLYNIFKTPTKANGFDQLVRPNFKYSIAFFESKRTYFLLPLYYKSDIVDDDYEYSGVGLAYATLVNGYYREHQGDFSVIERFDKTTTFKKYVEYLNIMFGFASNKITSDTEISNTRVTVGFLRTHREELAENAISDNFLFTGGPS